MTPANRATAVVFTLFASGLLGGAWAGVSAVDRARDAYSELDTLVRVLGTVEKYHADPHDPEELTDAAIRGLVDRLDPHSRWMSVREYRSHQDQTRGDYEGIGVELRIASDGPYVVDVISGSPAARDGVVAGDRILEVDGAPLYGLSFEEIADVLQGPRGAEAVLTIERDGTTAPVLVRTIRDRIHTPSVETARLPDGTVYVRLTQFQDGSAEEVTNALRRARREGGLERLVLDLRDNRGGLLSEAVAIADLFLVDGLIVTTHRRNGGEDEVYEASSDAISDDVSMAVLINGMSASASEIIAGAMRDTGRALLVGTRTYGKGSMQTVYEDRDGSALKLTIGRYYTPSGEPIADLEGVEPELEIPWPVETNAKTQLEAALSTVEGLAESDRAHLLDLASAIDTSSSQASASIPWHLGVLERLDVDPQLQGALEAL